MNTYPNWKLSMVYQLTHHNILNSTWPRTHIVSHITWRSVFANIKAIAKCLSRLVARGSPHCGGIGFHATPCTLAWSNVRLKRLRSASRDSPDRSTARPSWHNFRFIHLGITRGSLVRNSAEPIFLSQFFYFYISFTFIYFLFWRIKIFKTENIVFLWNQ